MDMEKLEIMITYYEDNDLHLKDEYWVNKSNVNLFINNEIEKIFGDSRLESENFQKCMEYITEKYPKAKLVDSGTFPTGWDFIVFEL